MIFLIILSFVAPIFANVPYSAFNISAKYCDHLNYWNSNGSKIISWEYNTGTDCGLNYFSFNNHIEAFTFTIENVNVYSANLHIIEYIGCCDRLAYKLNETYISQGVMKFTLYHNDEIILFAENNNDTFNFYADKQNGTQNIYIGKAYRNNINNCTKFCSANDDCNAVWSVITENYTSGINRFYAGLITTVEIFRNSFRGKYPDYTFVCHREPYIQSLSTNGNKSVIILFTFLIFLAFAYFIVCLCFRSKKYRPKLLGYEPFQSL